MNLLLFHFRQEELSLFFQSSVPLGLVRGVLEDPHLNWSIYGEGLRGLKHSRAFQNIT